MKNKLKRTASALGLALLFSATVVHGAVYAKKFDMTVVGVPEGITLSGFPLLVRLSTAIGGFAYTDFLGTNGSDLHFENSAGVTLPYEIDTWNEQGESLVWVKVPNLTRGDVITVRYGCAAPDANDPTDVWSNYVGVWHGNANATDSTTNRWAVTNENTVKPTSGFSFSSAESGHLGSSWFNSDNTKGLEIILGPATAENPLSKLDSASKFAASAWVHLSTSVTKPDFRLFSSKCEASQDGFEFMPIAGQSAIMLRGSGNKKTLSWTGGTGTSGYKAFAETSTSRWFHMACVFDSDADATANGKIFINGDSLAGAVDAPKSAGKGLTVGGYGGPFNSKNVYAPILGYVDEIRIYNGVPSDAYLVAEHTQVQTSGYVAFGAVENGSADIAEIASAPTVVRNVDGSYTISATVTGAAGFSYDLAVELNGFEVWSETWSAMEGDENHVIAWTTDANVADGTYQAAVAARAPSGTTTRRAAAAPFLVGDVAATPGSDAYEQGLVPGSFTLSRPGDAELPLTVAYAVSSDKATSGVSYRAFSGTATFEAGASTAIVEAIPINDITLRSNASLTLALAEGDFYGVSPTDGTASIILVDYAVPPEYNVWIAQNDGNASYAANWSLGRAPTSEDHILLGAWSSRNLTWDALASRTVASWTQNADFNGMVSFQITYEGATVDSGFNLFTILGNVDILSGSWVHPVQGRASTAESAPVEKYRLAVAVGGDFNVGPGVKISALGRGRGWWSQFESGSQGVHAGFVITTTNAMHAVASNPLSMPFGSILEPVSTGKGAVSGTDAATDWGMGGGAIHIVAGGAFVNNGDVLASAQNATSKTGGSGGSIYVRAASITGSGSFAADATASAGSGSQSASSGGRVALVATGVNSVPSSNVSASGSRSPDQWRYNVQPYWEGASGTVWLESSSAKMLLVRNAHAHAAYIRAYTPIPADDDAAAAKAAFAAATLNASDNARVRVETNLRFDALEVQTAAATLAHVDLFGNTLTVSRLVDSEGNAIASSGVFTLADAIARGWTWFEDSSATLNEGGTAVATVGTGTLVVGNQATLMIFR